MHSEVEKLVERIAHLRGQIVDATGPLRPVDRLRLYADEPGDWEFSPDDAETVVELLDNLGHATREAASLIERLYREREELREALGASMTALDDWLNVYASEFCDEDRVKIAQYGTIAYIAHVQEANRNALAEQPQ